MTQLVRDYIGGERLERIPNLLPNKSFEESIEERLYQYKGKLISELCEMFNVDSKAKNLNEILISKMLSVKGKLSSTDEFVKANIVPKTIRLESTGRIKESMSFPTFKFKEIIKQSWEESDLRDMFETTKFMFVIFRQFGKEYYFDSVKFWNMPISILDNDVKNVWEKTVNVIKSGSIVKKIKNGKRITNFPGMADNKYCHVRPHAQKASDVYPLPINDQLTGMAEYTKQCFWLNNSYVLKIINQE